MSATITADEIKSIRGKYQLSQRAFAGVLGIGSASIARYEQGAEPSKANANLIRAADNPRFMMECVERDGGALTQAQRDNVSRVYYASVALDDSGNAELHEAEAQPGEADEAARRMNEVYDHTLKQEVLNELAANLACDIMRFLLDQSMDTRDRSNATVVMLEKIFEAKNSILDIDIGNDSALEQIGGFLKYASEMFGEIQMQKSAA